MAGTLEITMDGIKGIQDFFKAAPDTFPTIIRDSVNGAIRFGFAESSRQIRKEVNFSQDYIGSAASGNRLKITRFATAVNPEAVITAAQRPVSLARFADTKTLGGKNGVNVTVKPGMSKRIAHAFLIKLKAGNAAVTGDNYNIGLAIRLKPGEKVQNKTKLVPYGSSDPNLYLLYGPSVDQDFRDVRDKVEPAIVDYLATEFFRQFDRQTQ